MGRPNVHDESKQKIFEFTPCCVNTIWLKKAAILSQEIIMDFSNKFTSLCSHCIRFDHKVSFNFVFGKVYF